MTQHFSRRDGWAAAPPTFTAPLDFPAKDSVGTELSGGRWRRGARGCARGGARVPAERLPCQEPSLGLREVPKSQRLPGPATHGAVCRRPPPTSLPSSAPARRPGPAAAPSLLLPRARPLALSPDARARAARGRRRRRRAGGARGRGRDDAARARRPTARAVIGAGARPAAAASTERAPRVRPVRPAARTGSQGARLLSSHPFGCQRPGGWPRTPRGGQRGPRYLSHHSLAKVIQQL